MSQKDEFIKMMNSGLKHYRLGMSDDVRSDFCLKEKEGFDFDVEATFVDWATAANVNYMVIDVATATREDLDAIAARWNQPTAYLFKNFGDESAGNIRNNIRCFVKDRYLGIRYPNDTAPQVIFCAVTILKEQPIQDYWDRCSLFSFTITC